MRYPQILSSLKPKLADITRWNKDDGEFLSNVIQADAAGMFMATDEDLVRLQDLYWRYGEGR